MDRERDLLDFDADMEERLHFSTEVHKKNQTSQTLLDTPLKPHNEHVEKMLLFLTCVCFFRSQIIRMRLLPAEAFVWMSLTQDVCHRH